MVGLSENAKAFRASMDGLIQEHAADARAVEQSWKDTASAADKNAQAQMDQAQKLLARVRERADSLEEQDEPKEIGYYEDDEEEEVDPEVERFSQQLLSERQALAAEAPPAAESAHQQSPQWQAKAGRFGGEDDTPVPEPPAPPPPAPAPQSQRSSSGGSSSGGSFWDDLEDDVDDDDWLR